MHNILQKCSRVFVPVFLYDVTMLIFQIKRIISSEKWFNYVVTCFFVVVFFQKMPNIWVGRTTLNGEKDGEGLRWPKKQVRVATI